MNFLLLDLTAIIILPCLLLCQGPTISRHKNKSPGISLSDINRALLLILDGGINVLRALCGWKLPNWARTPKVPFHISESHPWMTRMRSICALHHEKSRIHHILTDCILPISMSSIQYICLCGIWRQLGLGCPQIHRSTERWHPAVPVHQTSNKRRDIITIIYIRQRLNKDIATSWLATFLSLYLIGRVMLCWINHFRIIPEASTFSWGWTFEVHRHLDLEAIHCDQRPRKQVLVSRKLERKRKPLVELLGWLLWRFEHWFHGLEHFVMSCQKIWLLRHTSFNTWVQKTLSTLLASQRVSQSQRRGLDHAICDRFNTSENRSQTQTCKGTRWFNDKMDKFGGTDLGRYTCYCPVQGKG